MFATAALVLLVLGILGGHRLWPSVTGAGSSSGSTVVAASSPLDTSAITAAVDPGLVDVNTTLSYQDAKGAGTGIVLTSNGEVLTNNHVVEEATRISVTDIGNGKTYSATVVGYDPSKDVAVLQLKNASGLQTAPIGNSSSAAVGESIVGIGNAGGAGGTPSAATGTITARNQAISAESELTNSSEQLVGLLETNADIQPGDSGGPLVNSSGQVIGMDTAASQSGYFTLEGATEAYAIPIDVALTVAKEIEAGHGSATVHVGATAFIGIEVQPTQSTSYGYGGYPGGYGFGATSPVNGLEIQYIVPGAPAAKSGLAAGDVITAFDGHKVSADTDLTDLLLTLHPGVTVTIGWSEATGGATHTTKLTLASGPAA